MPVTTFSVHTLRDLVGVLFQFVKMPLSQDRMMLQSQAVGKLIVCIMWGDVCLSVCCMYVCIYVCYVCMYVCIADTLGILARTINADLFRPLTPDCISIGMVGNCIHLAICIELT